MRELTYNELFVLMKNEINTLAKEAFEKEATSMTIYNFKKGAQQILKYCEEHAALPPMED